MSLSVMFSFHPIRRSALRPAILYVLLWGAADTGFAQDTHYWTNQFGTRSVMLGGAVVGGISDNSSVYYNPASLGFMDSASISLNATSYQFENIRVRNALGENQDLTGNRLGSIPLLLSGVVRSPKSAVRLGYGFVRPVDFAFRTGARVDRYLNIFDDPISPGPELFVGDARIESRLTDDLFCLAAGKKLKNGFSIGLSHFFSYRSQLFSRTTLARFILNDPTQTLVSSSFLRNLNYYMFRYIPKLGLQWKKGPLSLGLTLTLPSVGLYGRGSIGADITVQNVLIDSIRRDLLANDRQQNLKATYRSPLSVAAGMNYDWSRSHLGLTLEYFARQSPYVMLRAKPAPFVRPDSLYPELSSNRFLVAYGAARPVLNVAVGYEYALSPRYVINTSFRTNFSAYDKRIDTLSAIRPEWSSWNLYHLTLGGTLKLGKNQITLGVTTSYGVDNHRNQDGYLGEPTEENLMQGVITVTRARYLGIGLMLGYTFQFGKR